MRKMIKNAEVNNHVVLVIAGQAFVQILSGGRDKRIPLADGPDVLFATFKAGHLRAQCAEHCADGAKAGAEFENGFAVEEARWIFIENGGDAPGAPHSVMSLESFATATGEFGGLILGEIPRVSQLAFDGSQHVCLSKD